MSLRNALRYLPIVLLLGLVARQAAAQSIAGVYIAQPEGGASRNVYTIAGNGADRFSVADLFGNAVEATPAGQSWQLSDGGQLQWEGLDLVLAPAAGPALTLQRVFGTDADFPLDQTPGPVPVNPLLAGGWDIVELSLDPVSGEVLPQFDGSDEFIDVFDLDVIDGALRFTDSTGTYFQGSLRVADEAVFRIINNPVAGSAQTPMSLPGSENNFARDVLGWARLVDINRFEVLLLLQTYFQSNPGQFLLPIEGTRIDPFPAGDLDGNRLVDNADRSLLTAQYGLDPTDAPYQLAADLDGNRYINRRDSDRFDGNLPAVQSIGPWMSGLWFNPARDGEGFHLLVVDDATAVVAWFTYRPGGGQAWMIGTARIDTAELIFDEMIITSGARFGSQFDSGSVLREAWGNVRIFFDDGANGWLSFGGTGSFGNGGYALSRLTTPVGLACGSQQVLTDASYGRVTGVWFDPAQDGAGWFVDEIAGDQAVVTWFTYDLDGNQQWMIGNGSVADGVVTIDNMELTSGARFGSNFDPADVLRSQWGTLNLNLDCEQGALAYTSVLPGFESAQQAIVPLARIGDHPC